MIFPRDKYCMVSRRTIFVCRIVTLLKFLTYPLMTMFSPLTYPKMIFFMIKLFLFITINIFFTSTIKFNLALNSARRDACKSPKSRFNFTPERFRQRRFLNIQINRVLYFEKKNFDCKFYDFRATFRNLKKDAQSFYHDDKNLMVFMNQS